MNNGIDTPNAGLEGLVGLLPCPFCGGEARLIGQGGVFRGTAVVCVAEAGCTASLGEHYDRNGEDEHYFSSEKEAITTWNTRTMPGAEGDARDAARWRHARKILPVEFIEQAQDLYEAFGVEGDETENLKADAAIDTALASRRKLGGA